MALGGTVDILATEDPDAIAEEHEELQIYEKHNNLLHGSKRKKYAARVCLSTSLNILCGNTDCVFDQRTKKDQTCSLFQG